MIFFPLFCFFFNSSKGFSCNQAKLLDEVHRENKLLKTRITELEINMHNIRLILAYLCHRLAAKVYNSIAFSIFFSTPLPY